MVLQVPCKHRLVVLAALLRKFCQAGRPAKLVVFFSCCDAVEYLHRLFDEVYANLEGERLVTCPLLKLHGNLPQVRPQQLFTAVVTKLLLSVANPA